MSNSSSDQAIAESIYFQLGSYAMLSSFVVLLYDFFLTLPAEIQLIWSRQLTGSSMILIMSRYSLLLAQVFQMIFNIKLPGQTLTDTSCGAAYLISQISYDTTEVAVNLLSILRVYALFGQKRSLLILLCPFIIATVVLDILLLLFSSPFTSQGTDDEPFTSCLVNAGLELEIGQLIYILVMVISPLLRLIFDSIIFILTLIKMAGYIMQSRKSGTHSIAEVVLRDGSLYFLHPSFQGYSITGQYFNITYSNTTAPPLSTLDFAANRFLGNIGAPKLDYNQWDIIDELEINGDRNIEWEILDNTVDPLTTLVPVPACFSVSLTWFLLQYPYLSILASVGHRAKRVAEKHMVCIVKIREAPRREVCGGVSKHVKGHPSF
ncbi:hypothetical protein BDP27DRAFT_1368983 [Rhodocollybia butyracea]|uniref:DUF6533 domain-containing protein n=1 Tax=Rhodocollybia butyracea TaxID=206335 RepID=A0A9P5PFC3_9AGAR|nr:hypothetical protein BDP27DRAFT_1368983 [Rhodocollybia butyracea]